MVSACYVLRQKTTTGIWTEADQDWRSFGEYVQKAGQSVWLGAGYLTQSEIYPVNLLAHWKSDEKESWCLATNLPDKQGALACYKRRPWIEMVGSQMTNSALFVMTS
jgi:hypothetical protein